MEELARFALVLAILIAVPGATAHAGSQCIARLEAVAQSGQRGPNGEYHDCGTCQRMLGVMRQCLDEMRRTAAGDAARNRSQRAANQALTHGLYQGGMVDTAAESRAVSQEAQAVQEMEAEVAACTAGHPGPKRECGAGSPSGSQSGPPAVSSGGSGAAASSEPTSAPLIGDITNAVQGVDQIHYAGGASAGSIGLSSQNLDQSAAPLDQCPAGQVVLEIDFPGGVKCGPWPPATPPELDFGQTPALPPSSPAVIGQTLAQPDLDPPATPPAPSLLGYPLGSPSGMGASPSTSSAPSTAYSAPAGGGPPSPPASDSDSSGSGGGGLGDAIRQGGRMLPKPADEDLRRKQGVMVNANAAAGDCLSEALAGTDDRTCGQKIGANALAGLLPDGVQRDVGKVERFVKAVRKAPAWLNAKLDRACDSGSAQCVVTRRYLHRLFGLGDDP